MLGPARRPTEIIRMSRIVLLMLTTLLTVYPSRGHRASADHKQSPKVLTLMKQVLCRNFPDVPCQVIMSDAKLSSLISQSIQQIRSQLTSPAPEFDQQKDSGYYTEPKMVKKKRKKLNSNILQRKMISGNNRKITKFFPQKIHNDNELTMSIESPVSNSDGEVFKGKNDFLWKIDYMKHGEPSFSEGREHKGMGDRAGGRRKYVMKPNVLIRKRLRPDELHSGEN